MQLLRGIYVCVCEYIKVNYVLVKEFHIIGRNDISSQ